MRRITVFVVLALLSASLAPARAHHEPLVPFDRVVTPGYVMTTYALGAETPTSLTFGPDGHLYVSSVAGTIYRFRAAVDGVAALPPEIVATGLDYPLGLAFDPQGALYVTSVDTPNRRDGRAWGMVSRIALDPSRTASAPQRLLVDIPNGHSQTNGIAFGPDGDLYVAVGSSTDDGVTGPAEIFPLSGAVLRFDPADAAAQPLSALRYRGSGGPVEDAVDVVAYGLRNHYDLAFRGEDLYLTMNGPESVDPYGDDLLLVVRDARGASYADGTALDFGFPGCVYTHDDAGRAVGVPTPHPGIPEERKGCDGVTPPLASLGHHPSSNGLDFAPDTFGAYGGDVFVAQWGSFSYVPMRGRKVLRVGLAEDGTVAMTPEGRLDIEDFAFVSAPIDLVFHEGAMYVADFGSGAIVRVAPAS